MPHDAGFCPDCGTKLVEPCIDCSALNGIGYRFCKKCGRSLHASDRGLRTRAVGIPLTFEASPATERPFTNGVKHRTHECRACHSTAVERDWRLTRFERFLLALLGRKLYVCRDCRRRFYDKPVHVIGRHREP